MTIKLSLSSKTIKIGDVIRAEEGFKSNREIIDFLAGFAVDDDGNPIERAEAMRRLMDSPLSDLPDLVRQVQDGIMKIQGDAVPLETNAV